MHILNFNFTKFIKLNKKKNFNFFEKKKKIMTPNTIILIKRKEKLTNKTR